jgi:hypothetical protein
VWSVGLTLLMIPFGNQENTTVLLDVPFGLALVLAGVLVLRPAGAEMGRRHHGPHVPVEGA